VRGDVVAPDVKQPPVTMPTTPEYLAANAHLPLSEAAAGGVEVWRGLRYRDAMRSLLSVPALNRLVWFIGTCLSLPVRAVPSLLDPAPRERSSTVHGELYSYLFLGKEFIDELIEFGRADAQRWLDTERDEWRLARRAPSRHSASSLVRSRIETWVSARSGRQAASGWPASVRA